MDSTTISVTTKDGDLTILKDVFITLLEQGSIPNLNSYKTAMVEGTIPFSDLKELASKADIPYALLFAPTLVMQSQRKNFETYVYGKLPSQNQILATSRGKMHPKDVERIARDLITKQDLLKKLLPNTPDNTYIGIGKKALNQGADIENVAQIIRNKLKISLSTLRLLPKAEVLTYLIRHAEKQNILVSLSSGLYMPQRLKKDIEMSGMCIKDKKFPYIFVNTRDGDIDPLILESDGRQIFTLTTMLVCIALNKYILNLKNSSTFAGISGTPTSIAGAVLIPKNDLIGISIGSLTEIKALAKDFKVTPSMLIMRLREAGLLSVSQSNQYFTDLKQELSQRKLGRPSFTPPLLGYSRYNGGRLSFEVFRGEQKKKISHIEVAKTLFKKGHLYDKKLMRDYRKHHTGI
jgi:Zn-dependent peptidase ImmA (M78 family)